MLKAVLALGLSIALASTAKAGPSADIAIRGGLLVSGDGSPPVTGDLEITGDRITYVGPSRRSAARRNIEANGLVVSPGFIDAHSHADTWTTQAKYRLNEPSLLQGVTTTVGGPDGFLSPADLRKRIEAFRANGVGTNFAFYVGHNGIRREVMGSEQGAPTAVQLARMRALVSDGMRMGAVGFSTGLMYEPGMFSATDEVVELTKQVLPFGGIYDTHTRNPLDMRAAEGEAIEIGRRAGVPVKLAHLKAVSLRNEGRIIDVIQMVNQARSAGQLVVADQYPYDGAATLVLNDLLIVPGVTTEERGTPLPAARDALIDLARLAKVRDASENGLDGGFAWLKFTGYDAVRIVSSPESPELEGQYISERAERNGRSGFDELRALILGSSKPIVATVGAIREKDVRALMVEPWVMVASDGEYVRWPDFVDAAAHPRSTGTFVRVLGRYVREEKLIDLGEAVRRMTSLPARFLGLKDRGELKKGYFADVVVFDPAKVADASTWTDPGRSPVGVNAVFVNGTQAVASGVPTGVAAGQILRRAFPTR